MLNILVVGDSYVDPHFCEGQARWFYIGESPPFGLSLAMSKKLCCPTNFDLERYDKKLLEILIFCEMIKLNYGLIDYVVANTEYTILCGAAVRNVFDVPGRRIKDVAVFRNKFLMKCAVKKASSVVTSPFVGGDQLLSNRERAVHESFEATDYPLVVKAANQAGSRYVYVVSNAEEAAERIAFLQSEGIDCLVEKFVDAPVIHIDGIWRDGRLIFVCASRYVDDCYAWQNERVAMSSVIIDDESLRGVIVRFASDTLASLGTKDSVFHLEAFLMHDNSLIFLEIASRSGGAAIVPCIKSVYGVDLLKENFNIDFGIPSELTSSGFLEKATSGSAGWIVLAHPDTSWCEVISISEDSSVGDKIIWKEIPKIGDRYNDGFYEDPAVGMFVVRGECALEVKKTINHIKTTFSVKTRSLERET